MRTYPSVRTASDEGDDAYKRQAEELCSKSMVAECKEDAPCSREYASLPHLSAFTSLSVRFHFARSCARTSTRWFSFALSLRFHTTFTSDAFTSPPSPVSFASVCQLIAAAAVKWRVGRSVRAERAADRACARTLIEGYVCATRTTWASRVGCSRLRCIAVIGTSSGDLL